MLSIPDHPNSRGIFLATCMPWYVSTVFFVKKEESRPFFNLPTSLESILGMY